MKKPNIVFILTDDQGSWAMNCAGNYDLITPNLDRLAKNGIRFDNFFCASPVCSPARASILTGKMPSAHGVLDWLAAGNLNVDEYPHMSDHPYFKKADRAIDFLEGQNTYVEFLQKAGYRCGFSGKWHLGDNAKPKKGFEKWASIGHGMSNYTDAAICEDGQITRNKNYLTDVITDNALRFLEEFEQDDKPFYLSVHYNAPHAGWGRSQHQEEFLQLYDDCEFKATPNLPIHQNQCNTCKAGDTVEARRENLTGYYAAITAMDKNVGRILDCLEENKSMDNTVIIFTSDNGMNMGHHGIWGKGNGTYPPNLFDTSIKVPFIINAPFLTKKDYLSNKAVSHCDLFPTMLEIAGIDREIIPFQCGESFYEYLKGAEKEDRNLYMFDEYGAVRMIRTTEYKLVYRYNDYPSELYDLKKDPAEEKNEYPNPNYEEIKNTLKVKMEEWFEKHTDCRYDGRKPKVMGRGQTNHCYKDGSFLDTIIMYHDKRENT